MASLYLTGWARDLGIGGVKTAEGAVWLLRSLSFHTAELEAHVSSGDRSHAMVLFRDRKDAGVQLGQALVERRFEHPIVLGIPRGGVVVSVEVAKALNAAHGVVVARKLGAPMQPELAIGAITASGATFVDQSLAEMTEADARYLQAEKERQMAEARRREEEFDSHRRPLLKDRTVIVVDDGVATGATALAAVRGVKADGARLVVFAVPVGPPHTIANLQREADEVICLSEEPDFFAVGQFYVDFEPIEDQEVKRILDSYHVAAATRST